MKVALCLNGTLRGVNNCLPTLYQNVISVLDADVFACFNREHDDDHERIKKLPGNIIETRVDVQENLINILPDIFWHTHFKLVTEILDSSNECLVNYISPVLGSHASLIHRYNWYRLYKMMEKYLDRYDAFIVTRPDHYYLFPIFGLDFIKNNQEYMLNYNEHNFWGINADFLIVSRENFINWFGNNIKYFIDENYVYRLLDKIKQYPIKTSEVASMIICEEEQIKLKSFSINSFISADSLNECTSKVPIQYDETNKHYFKYFETQYLPTIKNFNLYNNGHKWQDSKDGIYLNIFKKKV